LIAPSAAVLKVLFFGGSFDPPHRSHRAMLQAAIALVQPDKTLLVPTGNASSYKQRQLSPAQHRLAMCELAFADLPSVEICPIEAQSQKANYTLETLEKLEAQIPANGQPVQWFLLLGADQYAAIQTWHRWQALLGKVTVVLADRAGIEISHKAAAPLQNGHNSGLCRILHLPLAPDQLSSTALRLAIKAPAADLQAQALIKQSLDARVLRYIAQHSLYSSS
jgi:nicotinate-nucleotide adenylyltransferase